MKAVLGAPPSKIIAVHVSYRSRAMQRGSVPAWPSYFLKPPSSLAASDDPVARPPGCALLAFEGEVALVIGCLGGRTIINTVLETVVGFVDFGMNVQEAIDAPRFHHQWLPDRIAYESFGFSPDTLALLKARGYELKEIPAQGEVHAVLYDAKADVLEGGSERRYPDGAAIGR